MPIVALGSMLALTPLHNYAEWRQSQTAEWSFDPRRGLLCRGRDPAEFGWERCELVPIEQIQGSLQ